MQEINENSLANNRVADIYIPTLIYMWVFGIAVMSICSVYSYMNIRTKVTASIPIKDNIYICDYIDSSFILGVSTYEVTAGDIIGYVGATGHVTGPCVEISISET